eukprot:scaffold1002_cov110-Skeletonema_menzelii.AAC.1
MNPGVNAGFGVNPGVNADVQSHAGVLEIPGPPWVQLNRKCRVGAEAPPPRVNLRPQADIQDSLERAGGACHRHGASADNAAVKNVQAMQRTKECAKSMGQRWNYASEKEKDAQSKFRKEEKKTIPIAYSALGRNPCPYISK